MKSFRDYLIDLFYFSRCVAYLAFAAGVATAIRATNILLEQVAR